jgi:hypothetical protein
MTHRDPRDHKRNRSGDRSFYARIRDHRRRKERRLLSETLEPRQLLAGPDLIGIQPNEGSLINGGETLFVSPREIVFRFDDATELDPSTLGGIRITRAGADGVFESATATSDLGTAGAVLVEFRAIQSGGSGNGIMVQFESGSRPGSAVPLISVVDRTVTINVNSNPSNPTRVQGLITAVANHPIAKDLLEVIQVSGSAQTPVGTTITRGSTLTLAGANAAEATTDFGTDRAVTVRIVSQISGTDGLDTKVTIERKNFLGVANPLVIVEGKNVRVQLNSFPGQPSTVQDFITAINTNSEASRLINVLPQGGDMATPIGAGNSLLTPIKLSGVTDVEIKPGYVGLGDSPREVVFRFAEPLPDDLYQISILGTGPSALLNTDGEAFGDGVDETRQFKLNLGPRVVAVVPEPVRRNAAGNLVPQVGKIEIYFNGDDSLNPTDAINPSFYQLIYTNGTASNLDDVVVPVPAGGVSYNPAANVVTLSYGQPLARMRLNGVGPVLTGPARLRVGNATPLPTAPVEVAIATDPADTFAAATPVNLSSTALNAVHLTSEIRNTTDYGLVMPGPNLPGVRHIRPDDPSRLDRTVPLDVLTRGADAEPGITTIQYDFPESWQGDNPTRAGIDELRTYFNLITEQQKDRVREVLSLFSEYLGVQFVETSGAASSAASFSIAVGELYGGDPRVQSAPAVFNPDGSVNTTAPESIVVVRRDRNQDGIADLAVLDFQDFDESDDDQLGGEFFRGAFLAVGQLLGYGAADYLPQPVTQSTRSVFNSVSDNEPAFPGVADIVNGQFMYRPESADVDMYRFSLTAPGKVSIETLAERLSNPSLLNTALRLYQLQSDGSFTEIAQNDDYFSNDSLVELDLDAGTYIVGVSARGNTTYDPLVAGTGFGGLTEGAYQLSLKFAPAGAASIRDTTGQKLDGDDDGRSGGMFNYWFVPTDPNATIYVDKEGPLTGNGSVSSPYREIDQAIAASNPGDTIRVVGNGGIDGDIGTLEDNIAYMIGRDNRGIALEDGATLNVPKGVNLVIDAGAVFKMRRSRIGVGSTAPLVDQSNAALQILGTPFVLDINNQPLLDRAGAPISGSVIFTSFNDDLNPTKPDAARAGDWGGIDFRGDLDAANSSRVNLENQGIFLNHIQFADLRYGGGQVAIDGSQAVVRPIDMATTRPTIINSTITRSADAAMGATPNTFAESRFGNTSYTADYGRIGPHIRGNTVIDNTMNGLFIRVTTPSGDRLQPLTVPARMDDTDIVHVLTENLLIEGTPGGPVANVNAPSSLLIRGTAQPGNAGGNLQPGDYVYRISFVDAGGSESAASQPTGAITLNQTGSIELSGLPTVSAESGFVSRRLYRARVLTDGSVTPFLRVAELNSSVSNYVDSLLIGSIPIPSIAISTIARTDAGLKLDPGMILKLADSRIDVTLDAHFYAEGTSENPIVLTSLNDIRFGAGGTFDTNSTAATTELSHGDWAGVYVGFGGTASIDHAIIAGGGGTSRIAGGFASFNAIEVHQGHLRLANSRLEDNADGRGFINQNELDRGGRGTNATGTVFVRASQPTIVNNDFVNGHGPAASFDVNSMSFQELSDAGRSTGRLDAVASVGNSGPLIQGNRISADPDDPDLPDTVDPFGYNGIEIRGGVVATEVVFDDVDVVHIVRGSIEIPNQFIYGGMRLESDARGSLVVKFQGESAGIVAGGTLATAEDQFQDIADRIGGSLQIVGLPDFPVVLTALVDDTIGAGFNTAGIASVDTDNNGVRQSILTAETAGEPTPPGLPLGPEYDRTDREVNNATLIDNDIDPNVIGFLEAQIDDGGQVDTISVTGINRNTGVRLDQQNYQFLLTTIIDVENDGFFCPAVPPIRLIDTTITRAAQLVDDDRVVSEGTFKPYVGEDTLIQWKAETFILDNRSMMYTTLDFETIDGRNFNTGCLRNIDVISYLDSGAGADDQDTLYTVGEPGTPEFRAYVIDNQDRLGFSHGGIYTNDGSNQLNASYLGWSADNAARLLATINGENTTPSAAGDIDQTLVVQPNDPLFAGANGAFGIDDIGTAFEWRLDPNNDRARVTSFVEWIPSDPANPFPIVLPLNVDGTGSWDGVTIREAAHDRNVSITAENEPRGIQVVSDTNAIPGQAQFLGELAPSERAGDENRRLGFIVDGSISRPSDIDVYSFIGEAGTQVWLDIDRTGNKLDTVLELIDANGNTLILSDDSIAESQGAKRRITDLSGRFHSDNAGALMQLPTSGAGLTVADHQDPYSTNARDAGMRIQLPGEIGQRNLYHIRVRSSSVASGPNGSLLVGNQTQTGAPTSSLRRGLTSGGYQLQVRLGEIDEIAGTQIRHSDVRFAVNGVQVVGGPMHSPLSADEYEKATANDTRINAQPLGLYGVDIDAAQPLLDADGEPVLDANGNPITIVPTPHGPLSSDRLNKSVGGVISGVNDVDWYRFDIQYDDLQRDAAGLFLSTVFDLDYADGLARSDTAIYVFNAAGQLVLMGTDSNIADDQPVAGADTSDLSRGSFGGGDPFIGAAELAEGTYYIAVSNQDRLPAPLSQYFDIDSANPLLRLEPIDSVRRIVEDRIGSFGGGTASAPVVPLLFDSQSIVPYSLDDVLLYVNTGNQLHLINPFTGQRYVSELGEFGIQQGISEIAFQANGELFAYTNNGPIPGDGATQYVRIDASNATTTLLGGLGITTSHQDPINPPDDGSLNVNSNTGLQVNAITIAAFRGIESGYFVADRVGITNGLQYSRNVLYGFNEDNGQVIGLPYDNPNQADAGAGTSLRELGQIDVNAQSSGSLTRLGISAASVPDSQGVLVPGLSDGDTFTITSIGSGQLTFELEQGFTLVANNAPVRDGDRIGVDGKIFEFNTGKRLRLLEPVPGGTLAVGTTLSISVGGTSRTFEFVGVNSPAPGNAPVTLLTADGLPRSGAAVAAELANEINLRFPGLGAESFNSEVFFRGEPTTIVTNGPGVQVLGDVLVSDPTAIEVRVNETIAPDQLMQVLAGLFTANGIIPDQVGTQIALDFATTVSVVLRDDTLTTGLILDGTPGVESGNVGITINPGDSIDVIRQSIIDAIEANNNSGSPISGVGVNSEGSTGNSILISGGTVTATGNLTSGSQAVGGSIVGVELVGSDLYALSNIGGLYRVPSARLSVPGSTGNNPNIAERIGTATDLAGLNVNFTALRSGPDSVNGGELRQILFGLTDGGDIYAFNLAGELQPIFAGGRSVISTGISGARGLDFSTLDYNLWHVTGLRGADLGHGINPTDNGARLGSPGGNSLAFTFETGAFANNYALGELPVRRNTNNLILNPRQDGQLIENTYNFPGGAHGVVESNPFSLVGYAAADKPMLYFNYFMQTEGIDGADSLRVHVITPDGVEHLVATNNLDLNLGLRDDEFDDPNRTDAVDADVQPLYDTTRSINDTWRQARIPLDDFAQQSGLRLRVEFATAGTTRTTSEGLRMVSGDVLAAADDLEFVLQSNTAGGGNQRFQIEMAPTVSFPSGERLAALYANPSEAAVVTIEGQEYVLDDGMRTIGSGQIAIKLLAGRPSGTTLAQISSAEIAATVSRSIAPLPGTVNLISGVNFSDAEDIPGRLGRNDLLTTATPLPYSGSNAIIQGDGRLGTVNAVSGVVTNLDDVDLVRLTVEQGAVIELDIDVLSDDVADPVIRFFDADGNELPSIVDPASGVVSLIAEQDGAVFIGISGADNDDYDPTDSATVRDGDVDAESSYSVTVTITTPATNGSVAEFLGTTQPIAVSPASLFQLEQSVAPTNTIGIPISQFMSAQEVARVVQGAIADRFAGGDPDLIPQTGTSLRIAGLNVQDPGPFFVESNRYEFARGARAGTAANEFEGVYLDDFIIGFAERGELATASNPVGTDESFIPDGARFNTLPAQPAQPTVSGAYQLEIRDASEYVDSDAQSRFRTFDTNDRLSDGLVITVPAAADIVDGATFTIADIKSRLTFEFELLDSVGAGDGISTSEARVPIRIAANATDQEVANAIINALKSNSVRQVLDVQVSGANGNVGFPQALTERIRLGGDRRINLYGELVFGDSNRTFTEIRELRLRGDDNRQRDEQGVILIENSRFLFNADAGIDIDRSTTTRVQGVDAADQSPSALVYPRNLIELNSNRFLPGVVVQSNVFGFNANAGVRISGVATDRATQGTPTPTLSDAVAFDRILNNTIIGGNVSRAEETFPAVFAGDVVRYVAGTNVTAGFDDPTRALGVPDSMGRGLEPTNGEFTTSLGRGGVLTVAFTDNFLTGSGDARPDLVIFETGEIEAVRVEISRNGIDFIDVGIVSGIDPTIDLDAFGINAADRFGFVRVTDLRQGTSVSGPVGADIDAIGALSTVAADIYVPGSQGIVVQQGAAPTLLNNVLANLQTAIAVSDSSSRTVIGATTFYRNSTDARNSQPEARGLFAQQVVNAQEIFIDPVQLVFTPRAGTPIIDSSIDSLEDRSSLATVRGAIGLPPSPIIAPALDVNGQLRVDDPTVETPAGVGERVFKDRGGEDRADEVGPRAVLLSPRAPDIGLSGGEVTTTRGTIYDAFDIQLIDGIGPADPTPGVGIDDASVSGDSVLVTRDGVTLVEGVDYRFGYDPSNNVIRLTPLAGIWQDDSVYVVRLLDASDAVLRAQTGSEYNDGDLTTVIGLDGSFTKLEADTGIKIVIAEDLFDEAIDEQAIEIFDGSTVLKFEFDVDDPTTVSGDSIPVSVLQTASVPQLAAALAEAINASGLNLEARVLENRIQLLGSSTLASATPLTDAFTVTVTNMDLLISRDLVGVADGQTVSVSDGTDTIIFEYDSDGVQNNVTNVLVPIAVTNSTRQLAEALQAQIAASALNVTSRVVANRVEITADSPFATAAASSEAIAVTVDISGPEIGTSPGFGIRVPNDLTLPADSIEDGETFIIQRGRALTRKFELDFGGGIEDPTAIAVRITSRTLDGIADALVRAIAGAGLGLDPQNIGEGRVTLGGDANFILDLSSTSLEPIAAAGEPATIPVVIPIDATLKESAELYRNAILSLGLSGASVEIVGDRLIAEGIANFTGEGAIPNPIVRDDVGNQLQSNQANGRTELAIFVGGGYDYGDAPYASSSGDNAARHGVDTSFALAPVGSPTTVTPDSQPRLIDADDDNGVRIVGDLEPGFGSSVIMDVTNASGAAFQINAWFDWNANGVFEAGERITVSSTQFGPAAQGQITIPISVPAGAKVGETYARFRLFRPSENPLLGPDGEAESGEVEDYRIIVGSNPFQNPKAIFDNNGINIGRYDVNDSGFISALDALQIINAMRRNGGAEIDLSLAPLPADLPAYPDVNGDGRITALDALQVINKLKDLRGENEAVLATSNATMDGSYLPVGDGLLASGMTVIGDRLIAQRQVTESLGEPAVIPVDPPAEKIIEKTSVKASVKASVQTSVFDSAAVVQLDEIVDALAVDVADFVKAPSPHLVDEVFGLL